MKKVKTAKKKGENQSDNKFADLRYSIIRVKTHSFYVNEHLFNSGKDLKIELAQLLGINVDGEIIDFRLRVYQFYSDNPSNILSEIVVQNVFKVEQLKKYVDNNKLTLPGQLIISIVGISVSHSRALYCQNLAGTAYQDYTLPIVNTNDMSKQFYPQLFKENGDLQEEIEFLLTPKMPA